jgi:hypothetical protein
VEVDPALGLEWDRAVEEVHQHCFAATDATVNVKTHRGRRRVTRQKAEQAALWVPALQCHRQAVEGVRCFQLRRIALDRTFGDEVLISLGWRSIGHWRPLSCGDDIVKTVRESPVPEQSVTEVLPFQGPALHLRCARTARPHIVRGAEQIYVAVHSNGAARLINIKSPGYSN